MITLRPSALGAYVWLASCDIELKRYNEAVPPLEQALQAKPDHAGAHGYLGVALYHLGHHQEALEEITRALRIDPRLKPIDYWKGCL
jgi:tetratricopeptide (TPR) repeat protein